MITQVYYFPLDAGGNETEAILIALDANGIADISKLPADIRTDIERLGATDKLRLKPFYPKNGAHFLKALLAGASAYRHFRSTPQLI